MPCPRGRSETIFAGVFIAIRCGAMARPDLKKMAPLAARTGLQIRGHCRQFAIVTVANDPPPPFSPERWELQQRRSTPLKPPASRDQVARPGPECARCVQRHGGGPDFGAALDRSRRADAWGTQRRLHGRRPRRAAATYPKKGKQHQSDQDSARSQHGRCPRQGTVEQCERKISRADRLTGSGYKLATTSLVSKGRALTDEPYEIGTKKNTLAS